MEVECSNTHSCTRTPSCIPCVWLWSGHRTALSLHYSPFELLEISHLNSIGTDLFDLFACKLGAHSPSGEKLYKGEHNREPGASNVHLYGYYRGPWGQGGRWLILWTDPLFSVRNKHADWWVSSKCENGRVLKSISQWGPNKSLPS